MPLRSNVVVDLRRCAYCAELLPPRTERDQGGPVVNEEHVFADAVGGALLIPVHRSCNSRVNEEVDEPFLRQPLVVAFRNQFKIESRRRPPPPVDIPIPREGWGPSYVARFHGTAAPGTPPEILVLPSYESHDDGRLAAFGHVDPAEAQRQGEEWVRSVTERARRAGAVVERLGPQTVTEAIRVPSQYDCTQDAEVFPRQLAKIALGCSAALLGDSWIVSDSARLLREAVSRGDDWSDVLQALGARFTRVANSEQSLPFPYFDLEDGGQRLVDVREHAFGLFLRPDGLWCAVDVMGMVGARFRVGTTSEAPQGHRVWAVNAVRRELRAVD